MSRKQIGILLMPIVYGITILIFIIGMIGLAIKALIIEGLK